MTSTFAPLFFSVEMRKNSPVEKAMNASAMSARKLMPSITPRGTRSRQNGPSRMPETMYAVTFGSRSFDVRRVIAKPAMSISASETITADTPGVMWSLS